MKTIDNWLAIRLADAQRKHAALDEIRAKLKRQKKNTRQVLCRLSALGGRICSYKQVIDWVKAHPKSRA